MAEKGKYKRFAKLVYEQRALHVMAGLGVVWMLIFCYLPLPGLWIAFSNFLIYKPIFSSAFVGLKYFAQLFTDSNIPSALINTLGISGLNVTVGFVVPIIFAILLNEMAGRRYKKFVQTVSYLPHFVSWVILGGFLISWTGQNGFLSQFCMSIGITDSPLYWLAKPNYFWPTAVISGIWKEMGWGAIIYIAAIAGINPELYEVAQVEGANRWQRIWHITLPCIKGTIAILFTLQIAYILNSNFDQIFVLRNGINASRSTTLDIYIYRVGIEQAQYSYSAAIGFIKSIFALLLLLLSNKVSDKLTGASFM